MVKTQLNESFRNSNESTEKSLVNRLDQVESRIACLEDRVGESNNSIKKHVKS